MHNNSRKLAFLGLITGFGLALAAPCLAEEVSPENNDLEEVHLQIAKKHQSVAQLGAEELKGLKSEEFVIFDVREKEEFSVSHIEDSIWLSPSTEPEEGDLLLLGRGTLQ